MTDKSVTEQPLLKVHVLRPGITSVPFYATKGAAGMDLSAALEEPVELHPGCHQAIPTGISIEIPKDHEGQVRPRSGLAAKHAVTVLNAPGTIDEDYRGEVLVLLVNLGNIPYRVKPGDRIAQLVIAPVTRVGLETVQMENELSSTDRGQGGFGSTGA